MNRRGRTHLRNVDVHFVSVEIGIVGRGAGEVQSERGVVEDADAVTHDGHLVQRRLAVEEDDVAVVDVALDDHALLQRGRLDRMHPSRLRRARSAGRVARPRCRCSTWRRATRPSSPRVR